MHPVVLAPTIQLAMVIKFAIKRQSEGIAGTLHVQIYMHSHCLNIALYKLPQMLVDEYYNGLLT